MVVKQLLTAREVSVMLGIGRSTVYAYAESGILSPIVLPSAKPSKAISRNRKSIRFSVADIDKFLHTLLGWSPNIKEEKR
ncbi:MAG: helix-turn-helix domain-containing protein [Candidatus Margulisiibacteriota bacterium]